MMKLNKKECPRNIVILKFRLLLFVFKNLREIQFEKLLKMVSVTKTILNLPIRETRFREIFDLGSITKFNSRKTPEIKFRENFFSRKFLPLRYLTEKVECHIHCNSETLLV